LTLIQKAAAGQHLLRKDKIIVAANAYGGRIDLSQPLEILIG
jgi:hypothetical protein